MAEWTLLEAINQAFAWELGHDENVVVLGEDVGINGGVFRATDGYMSSQHNIAPIETPFTSPIGRASTPLESATGGRG